MMLRLAKNKPCSIILPFFAAKHHPLIRVFCSPSAIFSLTDYLVDSWGFSPDKAASFSKRRLTHLKSPEKPDAVLRFLNQQGFSSAEIQRLVTWHPNLLSSCPQTILEPNLNALRNMGLSTSTLNSVILTSPGALHLHSAVPRIKFWFDFFAGDEAALVKAFKSSRNLVDRDIAKNIVPKISFLRSHGFSTHDIQRMVCMIPRFMSYSIPLMEELLERAKELGFQPESGMFVLGLKAVSDVSREMLHKKMLVFKNFGWKEQEFLSALRKTPRIGQMSEENLREKIDFLLREANVDLSHIISRPVVLTYSLEKRLRPYLHVLHLLESKGLVSKRKGQGLCGLMSMTNTKFVERFILPHQGEIPELHNAFLATSPS